MQENDRAMRIQVSRPELQVLFGNRATTHDKREAFYADRVQRMKKFIHENVGPSGVGEEEDPVRGGKVSNSTLVIDAQSSMREADKTARAHRTAASICRFMAEHLPDPTEIFEGQGLEIMAYLLDTEHPTAMPPFWRTY